MDVRYQRDSVADIFAVGGRAVESSHDIHTTGHPWTPAAIIEGST